MFHRWFVSAWTLALIVMAFVFFIIAATSPQSASAYSMIATALVCTAVLGITLGNYVRQLEDRISWLELREKAVATELFLRQRGQPSLQQEAAGIQSATTGIQSNCPSRKE